MRTVPGISHHEPIQSLIKIHITHCQCPFYIAISVHYYINKFGLIPSFIIYFYSLECHFSNYMKFIGILVYSMITDIQLTYLQGYREIIGVSFSLGILVNSYIFMISLSGNKRVHGER